MNKRKKLGLVLLIAPTALLLFTGIGFGIVNFGFGPIGESGPNIAQLILNTILFITGLTGVMTWLPGLITGIILLVGKK